MLREILHVHQRPGEPRRRWFHTGGQDLYVWTDDCGDIVAFEYCYLEGRTEQAVVWKAEHGVSHYQVDGGETSALANRSPVLNRMHTTDTRAMMAQFAASSTRLPTDVADFVLARLGPPAPTT